MENNLSESCTCGNRTVVFYPDENQHEPACWECYFHYDCDTTNTSTVFTMYDIDHPDGWPF
jgi:hypothetical protein